MAIPYMPLSVRKTLLTTCRVQLIPVPNTRLWERSRKVYTLPFTAGKLGVVTLGALLADCANEIQSPIISGYVSMMVRNLPFDIDEVRESMEETARKEIDAAVNQYHPVSFNWACIFSHSVQIRHTTALTPSYPIDPEIHDFFYVKLQTALREISNTVFYPDYSRKTIGHIAQHNLDLATYLIEEYCEPSTLGLEILYVCF
jgi:hypothetical protein